MRTPVRVEPVLQHRQALAAFFAAEGVTVGAEIGVGDGAYARVLLWVNPILCLYAVDPWDAAGGNRRGEASFQATQRVFAEFPQRTIVLRMTSLEALAEVPDGALDFVFIDAAHDYASVRSDLEGWTPKVRSGGIVAGHDYYTLKQRSEPSGVVRAVDEWVQTHGYALQTTPWDRSNPDRDSRQPCWWVRR